jgi:predicted Zn-dependent protease with MMP-like domain
MEIKYFEKLVEEGLERLPQGIRNKMENVEIVIEEEPNSYQTERLGLKKGSSLFGLYQGVPKTKRGAYYGNVLPDKITLFQKVIEKHCKTPEAIKERVARTVWHEIAHHFGFNEEEVRNLEKKKFKKNPPIIGGDG